MTKNNNIYDETENLKKRAITIFYKSRWWYFHYCLYYRKQKRAKGKIKKYSSGQGVLMNGILLKSKNKCACLSKETFNDILPEILRSVEKKLANLYQNPTSPDRQLGPTIYRLSNGYLCFKNSLKIYYIIHKNSKIEKNFPLIGSIN